MNLLKIDLLPRIAGQASFPSHTTSHHPHIQGLFILAFINIGLQPTPSDHDYPNHPTMSDGGIPSADVPTDMSFDDIAWSAFDDLDPNTEFNHAAKMSFDASQFDLTDFGAPTTNSSEQSATDHSGADVNADLAQEQPAASDAVGSLKLTDDQLADYADFVQNVEPSSEDLGDAQAPSFDGFQFNGFEPGLEVSGEPTISLDDLLTPDSQFNGAEPSTDVSGQAILPFDDSLMADFQFEFEAPMAAPTSHPGNNGMLDMRYAPSSQPAHFGYSDVPVDPFASTPMPYYPSQSFPWGASSSIPQLYAQNPFGNITPAGTQQSSLDPSLWSTGPAAGAFNDPLLEDYSSLDEDYLSPAPRKRRAATRSNSANPMTKKARRATIKNYLEAKSAADAATANVDAEAGDEAASPAESGADTDGELSPSYPDFPSNVVSIPPGSTAADRQRHHARMNAMKAARRAAFGMGTSNPSPNSFHNTIESLPHPDFDFSLPDPSVPEQAPRGRSSRRTGGVVRAGQFVQRKLYGDADSSPPRIQGRRYKHAGRKIHVPQTPEVIARNAARRERYRNSLTPEQRRQYDAERPAQIRVTDVE